MSTPEGKVKDAVKKRLIHYGLVPLSQSHKVEQLSSIPGFFFMPVAGPYSVHGIHDFVGCWDGVFFSIETKSEDNPSDHTPAQQDFRDLTLKAGGLSMTGVRSADAVDRMHEQVRAIVSV